MQTAYENQNFRSSVPLGDLLSGQSIATIQAPYVLTHVEFLYLMGNAPRTETFAMNLLFADIGYAISLGPKFIALTKGDNGSFSTNEWITLATGLVLAVTIYVIGRLLRNDRRDTIKKIKEHFKNSPVTHRIIGDGK